MDKIKDRGIKIDTITQMYDRRNTQQFIAERLMMNINDIGLVLRSVGYAYTRKKTKENLRDDELINGIYCLDDSIFSCLDKYPLENFLQKI